MVKIQRNGTWVLFVIFGLAAVVALFMFSGKSGMTGNVVVEGYPDQATCEGAGYFWYNDVCNDVVQPAPVCDATHLSLCLDEPTCTVATGFWYNSLCNAQAQPVCDATHLSLCLDEPTCTVATGFWYNSLCNAQAQPVSCTEDWSCTDWSCSSSGTKTRECTDANDCGTTETKPSITGDCNPDTFGETATTTEEETTTVTTQTTITPSVCSAGAVSCANGNLYSCNADGSGWDLSQTCELGCAGDACAVAAIVEPTATCEDGLKNQDEIGVDCGGLCAKRCSIFTLAGSVVQGPAESTKQFFTNLFSNKTRMYLILGGVGFLVAGFVSYLCFFRKRKKKK